MIQRVFYSVKIKPATPGFDAVPKRMQYAAWWWNLLGGQKKTMMDRQNEMYAYTWNLIIGQ
jgi:hypothetical protein